jgi:hypothetical protein
VKKIRTISAYLLVLVFLVPVTGFYYTKHSCLKSGEVQFVLKGEYSCCSETAACNHQDLNMVGKGCDHEIAEEEKACCDAGAFALTDETELCSSDHNLTDCCRNEGNYLKSEDEFTSPGKIEIPHVKTLLTAALYAVELHPVQQGVIGKNAHSLPLSSTDMLLKHSVLII